MNIFSTMNNSPEWAVHKTQTGKHNELIHCPIPFVGKNYHAQSKKLLLYASAENLSEYHLSTDNYLDDDEFAIMRHRRFFDSSQSEDSFYPDVHIQPITDGGLAVAAYYLFCCINGIDDMTPREFLEKITFANYCKYTISGTLSSTGKQNTDYASNVDFLKFSHDYIESDISILKPDYIIMPKTIYSTDRQFIDSVKGRAIIIPIYQINAKNINMRIKKYPSIDETKLQKPFYDWWLHLGDGVLKGKTQNNFLSIFAYLDEVLANADFNEKSDGSK